MALPKLKIIIDENGNSTIEGEEKSDICFKLSELGKMAGKVVSETPKDHPPVQQTQHIKGA